MGVAAHQGLRWKLLIYATTASIVLGIYQPLVVGVQTTTALPQSISMRNHDGKQAERKC